MKKRDGQSEAKAQDGHTIVAQSSMMRSHALVLGNSVIVHAGRGKKRKVYVPCDQS